MSNIKARIEEAKREAKKLKEAISEQRQEKEDGEMSDTSLVLRPLGEQLECRRRLKGHHAKVYSMHFGPESSNNLVSVSQDGKLIVWDAFTTHKVQAFSLGSAWIMACGFETERGMHVACGGLDNVCSIYQLGQPQSTKERAATVSEASSSRKSRPARELVGHDGYISCCRFIEEQSVITSSGDSTCILWDVERNEVKERFTDHGADVMRVSVSPVDKNLFVSGSCDCTAKLWDIRTGKCAQTFQGHEGDLMSVAFFPDGQAFGTASEDSSCRLFDIRACGEINKYENDAILCGVTSVAFSKSGRLLFAGYDDCQCRVWDTLSSSGSHLWDLVDNRQPNACAHEDRVSCLDIHASGQALCTGSWDCTLKVWA